MNRLRLMRRGAGLAVMPGLWLLASGCGSIQKEPLAERGGNRTAQVLSSNPVPIEIVGAHVLVRGKLNGHQVRLVLDTGASDIALSPAVATAAGIHETVDARIGAFGSEGGFAKVGVAGSVEVGPAVAERVRAFIMPIPPVFEADGFLGLSFLRQFRFRLDYQQKLLFFEPTTGTNLPGVGAGVAMEDDGRLVIQAEVDGVPARLVVDSGAGQELILRAWFVEQQKLRERYPKRLNVITGAGLLGLTRGEITRLHELKLGDHALTNVFVEFEAETNTRPDDIAGYVGTGILERFNLTFDPAGRRIWIEPNAGYVMAPPPSAVVRSGLVCLPEGTVADVIPGSPAAEAGVRVGDRLLEINGVSVQSLKYRDIKRAFQAEPGTPVQLRLEARGEAPREVTLVLGDLL